MKDASVLIVDDEPPAVEVIARYLAAKGHRAIGAPSAEEAVVVLRAARFDLVLLDVVLPGITGLQALAELKRLTDAPIHMMSGQSGEDVRADALLLGASGFLPKPLDLAAIAALLDSLPPRG